MKVTAILLKWKREKELEQIISKLEHTKEIDEILVFDNTKINLCGFWRYYGTLEAKNEIIYVQDDDVLVYNIPELITKYENLKNKGKEQIVNNMTVTGHPKYNKYKQTLMGWGSLYNKNWVGILNKYIKIYGIDELLLRDTSRIFTGLMGEWDSIIVQEGKDIVSFPSASSKESALCMQTNHEKNRVESMKRIEYLRCLK